VSSSAILLLVVPAGHGQQLSSVWWPPVLNVSWGQAPQVPLPWPAEQTDGRDTRQQQQQQQQQQQHIRL
jgi:hypothetical protein